MKDYHVSVFIFRRDLRISDNTGLLSAVTRSAKVLPCFIFDPRQIRPHPYQSGPGLEFMLGAIAQLRQEFQRLGSGLTLFQGLPAEILREIIPRFDVKAVFVNRDYTAFSLERDAELARLCRKLNVDFITCSDYLLNEPEDVLNQSGQPYRVFTPFHKAARQLPVAVPQSLSRANFIISKRQPILDETLARRLESKAETLSEGRKAALEIFADLSPLVSYQETRDLPALDATTRLSAHLKFGTCSVREVYHAIQNQLGHEHPLLRQLYWRDFFTHVAFHYPAVFGRPFLSQYDNLVWSNNLAHFQRWRHGLTGFPIVDAGMRELNATGFMHNRVRMITASFLVKDLHIDWRWGERYFARKLTDYDPAVNNGNWQWAASTGCDAQPYFRIFNPWLQQKKFDPDAVYIKRWVPELSSFPSGLIHDWKNRYAPGSYPAPMVNHALESQMAKAHYRQLSEFGI